MQFSFAASRFRAVQAVRHDSEVLGRNAVALRAVAGAAEGDAPAVALRAEKTMPRQMREAGFS